MCFYIIIRKPCTLCPFPVLPTTKSGPDPEHVQTVRVPGLLQVPPRLQWPEVVRGLHHQEAHPRRQDPGHGQEPRGQVRPAHCSTV